MSFQYSIRALLPSEGHILRRFTYEAIFKRPTDSNVPFPIIERPELRCYWECFGDYPTDYCLVAELDTQIVGACWVRNIQGYGSISPDVPELALAILPEHRSKGIGSALLERLIVDLRRRGMTRISLAVQKDNYALKLYQNVGFTIIGKTDEEWLMELRI